MISFKLPKNLNGTELRKELNDAGVIISDGFNSVVDDGYGNLLLDIDKKDEAKASIVVANHNGTTIAPEPTLQDKLAAIGLNADDLKALGL
jgi:hypothetical protein